LPTADDRLLPSQARSRGDKLSAFWISEDSSEGSIPILAIQWCFKREAFRLEHYQQRRDGGLHELQRGHIHFYQEPRVPDRKHGHIVSPALTEMLKTLTPASLVAFPQSRKSSKKILLSLLQIDSLR